MLYNIWWVFKLFPFLTSWYRIHKYIRRTIKNVKRKIYKIVCLFCYIFAFKMFFYLEIANDWQKSRKHKDNERIYKNIQSVYLYKAFTQIKRNCILLLLYKNVIDHKIMGYLILWKHYSYISFWIFFVLKSL